MKYIIPQQIARARAATAAWRKAHPERVRELHQRARRELSDAIVRWSINQGLPVRIPRERMPESLIHAERTRLVLRRLLKENRV